MSEKKSPFASLEALKAALPPGEATKATTSATSAKDEFIGSPLRPLPSAGEPAPVRVLRGEHSSHEFEAKVVIARSRKGRGGKTVSIVTGVKAAAREAICRDLKKALGCGATIEDDAIVVLGDVADRARAWLEARGARRIVMGS